MTRKEFLLAADKRICGDRDEQYGKPEDNFENIAKLWSGYLEVDIGPEDVAIMMCLFKIARLKDSFYEDKDSWFDLIGYAACGGEIATRD